MIVDINWASVLGLLVVYGVVIYLFIMRVCVCRCMLTFFYVHVRGKRLMLAVFL